MTAPLIAPNLTGMTRRLLPSLMRIGATVALAGAVLTISPARAEQPFPGYAEACGYPIRYISTPNVALAAIDAQGRPYIALDPSLGARAERARMQFLVAHECAHLRMGHADPKSRRERLRSTKVVRDQEMSADCWAAELLARLGLDRPVQLMEQRFYRAGLYSPGGGYPAGIQRSTIIRQCADTGRRLRFANRPDPEGPVAAD